jgi:excisionase family DNA binding protein
MGSSEVAAFSEPRFWGDVKDSGGVAGVAVSRPTLMKMIGDGAIPAHRVGSHHRLRSDDVFAALRARRARERAAFADLLELEDDEV